MHWSVQSLPTRLKAAVLRSKTARTTPCLKKSDSTTLNARRGRSRRTLYMWTYVTVNTREGSGAFDSQDFDVGILVLEPITQLK